MAGKWIIAVLTIVWSLVASVPPSDIPPQDLGSKGVVVSAAGIRGVKILQNSSCLADIEGEVLNLTPLQRTDGIPRFSDEYKGRTYNFNPCLPFNLPYNDSIEQTFGDGCKQVAFCINQTTAHNHYYYTAGTHETAVFHGAYNTNNNVTMLELVYTGLRSINKKTTYIRLFCDRERTSVDDALFTVVNDRDDALTAELHHVCACLNGCIPQRENAGVNFGASAFLVLLVTLMGIV